MNALYQHKLVVNGELKEASSVQVKVESDIAFLENRIALMKQQKVPNNIVIDTYENMLKSRQSVLAWLRDGNSGQDVQFI